MSTRKTIKDVMQKKQKGEKIVMLTAYDYPLAKILDQCGVDIILIGDSLANVVLGLPDTKNIGMKEMLHHAKAVDRGVENALLIGDMPYDAYQINANAAVENAKRFIEEAGCDGVKVEWFENCQSVVQNLVSAGIPVMGHVGLTPQTATDYKVQGKNVQEAKDIFNQARQLESWGCFSVVMECVPDKLAKMITDSVSIPTIGIGASVHCDGQVLVTPDMLGLFDDYRPKFVKQYVDVKALMTEGVTKFKDEVTSSTYPDGQHSFSMSDEEWDKLKTEIDL
jgi:3-methyl-2-oxobutanoate hydroxymethyltransferase